MAKNLITGGLGFIGCYLARQLLGRGEEVVLFDVAPGSKLIEDVKDRVKIVRGDLSNWVHVLDAVKNNHIDCIYHCGAILPPFSEESPSAAFMVNVAGTFHVLEAARLMGVESVLFPITIATYGPGVPPEVNEDAPQLPPNMYGTTKVCGERLGEYYHRRFGVNFRAVRFPPIMGPGRKGAAPSAYSCYVIEEPALGRPYTVYVDKEARIPLLYVEDAVHCLIALKNSHENRLKRRIYNIHGFSPTAQELANAVRKHIPEAKIGFDPDPATMAIINNWPRRLDDARAREEWGWSPRYTLDEAVADFVAAVRANPAMYQ
ncbi:MAG TPA: NAD-dependent epimerase/dehydratase family protein [Dehalococcoidia bacterium]|jgi:threonine 3-dehydrogenase|nr:NAD-dependent epimerase/dehydratase family protein [Dehalococcoidia bacterium]